MNIFNNRLNKEINDLKQRMDIKDEQIKILMKFLGLGGYCDSFIIDDSCYVFFVNIEKYIEPKTSKQPVSNEKFNKLVNALGLEYEEKKILADFKKQSKKSVTITDIN